MKKIICFFSISLILLLSPVAKVSAAKAVSETEVGLSFYGEYKTQDELSQGESSKKERSGRLVQTGDANDATPMYTGIIFIGTSFFLLFTKSKGRR